MIPRKLIFPLIAFTAMATSYVAASVIAHNDSSEESSIGNFRSAVSISYQSRVICSGVILNKRWILTSANCIQEHLNDKDLFISYGSLDRNAADRNSVGSEHIILHPKFDSVSLVNNVALIKTKNDINFNDNVEPAKLPMSNTWEDEKAYAIGWTNAHEKNQSNEPDFLKFYETTVMALDLCWERIDDVEEADGIRIPDSVICTCGPADKTLPLFDNGSALISSETHEIIGIVSWYKSSLPKIYTRIYSMHAWIQLVMNEKE